MKNVYLFRLRRLCAFIIGVVFVIAGIFKLLDPVGAGLVMEGYLRFLHITFLLPLAKAGAVSLALLEAILGSAMICGVWRKPVAVITTAMIVFFTALTLLLAIFNPVSLTDCGCFGEVIHLTNFQTFLKNLVLLALALTPQPDLLILDEPVSGVDQNGLESFYLALTAFLPFRNFGKNRKRKYVSFGIVTASLIAFTVYSLTAIPLVDYTAFTPGSELLASEDDDDGNDDETGYYKSTIIYEKNGQEGAFDLDNLPDSTWTYVRTETIFINGTDVEDNEPALSFSDSLGNYHDKLATVGNVLAVSVYDAGRLSGERWTRIADALDGAKAAGFTPLLLVSSSKDQFDNLAALTPEIHSRLLSSTYHADRKTLVSLNRSNGGATWFSDGELIRKYSNGRIPSGETLSGKTEDDPTEEMLHSSTRKRLHFQGFILYVFALLLIL